MEEKLIQGGKILDNASLQEAELRQAQHELELRQAIHTNPPISCYVDCIPYLIAYVPLVW